MPLCTLYGCTIYSCVGVYSVCFFSKAVEGREDEWAEVKHPRFLYVADNNQNLSDFGCLADDILGAHWQRNFN